MAFKAAAQKVQLQNQFVAGARDGHALHTRQQEIFKLLEESPDDESLLEDLRSVSSELGHFKDESGSVGLSDRMSAMEKALEQEQAQNQSLTKLILGMSKRMQSAQQEMAAAAQPDRSIEDYLGSIEARLQSQELAMQRVEAMVQQTLDLRLIGHSYERRHRELALRHTDLVAKLEENPDDEGVLQECKRVAAAIGQRMVERERLPTASSRQSAAPQQVQGQEGLPYWTPARSAASPAAHVPPAPTPGPALNRDSDWVKYVGSPAYDAAGARVERAYFRHRLSEQVTVQPPQEWVREVREEADPERFEMDWRRAGGVPPAKESWGSWIKRGVATATEAAVAVTQTPAEAAAAAAAAQEGTRPEAPRAETAAAAATIEGGGAEPERGLDLGTPVAAAGAKPTMAAGGVGPDSSTHNAARE